MIVINNKEITSYGKSMYGGWYANYYEDCVATGTRSRTLAELCEKLCISRTALVRDVQRIDN